MRCRSIKNDSCPSRISTLKSSRPTALLLLPSSAAAPVTVHHHHRLSITDKTLHHCIFYVSVLSSLTVEDLTTLQHRTIDLHTAASVHVVAVVADVAKLERLTVSVLRNTTGQGKPAQSQKTLLSCLGVSDD